MSDPKHTPWIPGPWWYGVPVKGGRAVVADANGNIVCMVEGGPLRREVTIANARLIAAAPRLAAALERCADALDSFACDPPGFPSVEWTEEDAEAVREASAALREAGVES